jgi:hypothetical protein
VSIWIAFGITNPRQLCEWAGHSSVTMTYDQYGHELAGERETAVDQADRAWAARREGAG